MMYLSLLRFAAVFTLASWACLGSAAKPVAQDPVRKALVQAIRQHPALKDALQGWRMDIRQFHAEGEWAYVCALLIDLQGQHQHSEGLVVVQQIVLKRNVRAEGAPQEVNSGWVPVARVEGLGENARDVQCLTDERGQVTQAFLEGLAGNAALRLKAPAAQP